MRVPRQAAGHTLSGVTIRAVTTTAMLAAAAALVRAGREVPAALGASRAELARAARRSAHAVDGRFRNRTPSSLVQAGPLQILRALLGRRATGRPAAPVPLAPVRFPRQAAPLALTWFGHSSVLLELDGHRVLTDPVWSKRASPFAHLGPRRLHPPPAPMAALPPLDAVLISHDHYDHLDLATVRWLARNRDTVFVVPVGVGAHLRTWGVPAARVVELDWDESIRVGDLELTCTEARHFSGRGLTRNTTLWSSWTLTGPRHRAFFGGDTGYTEAFAEIGARLGPFDLVLLPIGAYSHLWPDVHMTPEEAVRTHLDLRGHLLVPVHWATFNLAFHEWAEPVTRLQDAAARVGVPIATPLPGERLDATVTPRAHDWWSTATRT